MNEFDRYIKDAILEAQCQIPDCVKDKIEATLSALPEAGEVVKDNVLEFKSKSKSIRKFASIVACFLFISLAVLPNCSTAYAQTLEKIPVIGKIVKVVTIRNYFYSDGNHDMNIAVPKIENNKGPATAYINKDVDELTKILADKFNKDMEENGKKGHSGIFVDYDVVTNNDKWFTLRMNVQESAASTNTYYKYYHIDKSNGKIVTLRDLFATKDFAEVLKDEIRRQMKAEMAKDSTKEYWIDNAEVGKDFIQLDDEQNFYWNDEGDLVIAFDKYEVGPGSMGTPEFTIKKSLIEDILKPEYKYK